MAWTKSAKIVMSIFGIGAVVAAGVVVLNKRAEWAFQADLEAIRKLDYPTDAPSLDKQIGGSLASATRYRELFKTRKELDLSDQE
jgi:hypothetical protein